MFIIYELLLLFIVLAQYALTSEQNNTLHTEEEHICITNAEYYTKLVPQCRDNPEIFDIIDDNILSNFEEMIDQDTIRVAVTNTCVELQNELECDIIEYNHTIPCGSLKYLAELRISMVFDEVVTEFLCENDGLRVTNLIPNDGLQLIFDNEWYDSCTEHSTQPGTMVDLHENEYSISAEYCVYLDNIYNCLKQYLNVATNPFIQMYEIDLHDRLVRQLNCTKFVL